MIIANTEALTVSQNSDPLPFQMATQSICPADTHRLDVWVEFLVRSHGALSQLSPIQLVERGYGSRAV